LKKKVLIFGGTGLFGINFLNYFNKHFQIIANYNSVKFFHPNLKYIKINLNKSNEILSSINKIKPDIIVNACAKTNIDWCAANLKSSYAINVSLAEKLAIISKNKGIYFIQISSDHLFSGRARFKTEKHIKNPLNDYAKQKSKGEELVIKNNKDSLIIRTNFFGYSQDKKNNFTTESINRLKDKKLVFAFKDYYFTPIYITNLLEILKKLIRKKATGIINIVGNERVSKYEFLLKVCKIFKLESKYIKPALISKSKLTVKRHSELSLSNKLLKKKYNIRVSNLNDQIKKFYKERKKNNVFNTFFNYGRHFTDKQDESSILEVVKKGALTQGPKILDSEKIIANYVGSKYAVAVSSCTAGLHLAAKACGLNEKQNLLTTPISFVATSNAAFYCNSKSFFSDIDPNSVCLDPKVLNNSYIKKNKIKCIAPVHFAGAPANMKEIYKFSKKNKLKIIEDAAHALGGKYKNGKRIGSCCYSDMTVFSFHPVKIIAGGEGGMITTNSKKYYQKLLMLRTHGITQNNLNFQNLKEAFDKKEKNVWYYEMNSLGYHYRQTDLHSSLIISQMKKIDLFLKRRSEIAAIYDLKLKKNKNIEILQKDLRKESSKHLYIVKINFKKLKKSRNRFMRDLLLHNIQTQVHYIPIPIHPFYSKKGYDLKQLPNAKNYYESCLSLPIHYNLTNRQVNYICQSINDLTA
jgi:UDP-4-amino-4,6-dideoxy-N-acetyl-beta-L-altrosamine transaminase/dTDP-4-dehydrorhamnose reductase